jgi:hypothetical protein
MSGKNTKDNLNDRSDAGTMGDRESLREAHPHRMDAEVVLRIVKAIHAHEEEKFGWTDVERISGMIVRGGFTRQALMAHGEIYQAYTEKKIAMGGPRPPAPTVEQSLRAEIAGLRSALQKLRQQIVRYQLNAELHGLNAESLDALLQTTDEVRKAERERLDRKRQKRIDAQRKRAAARRHDSRGKFNVG